MQERAMVHDLRDCLDDFEATLSPIQLTAMESLLDGNTHQEAAQAAGRSLRWMSSQINDRGAFRDAYQAMLEERRSTIQLQALEQSSVVLQSLQTIAADIEHRNCLKACEMLIGLFRIN